ncbi:beta-ketoacyl synthase N-terminal-like domain-containing protein [Paenibacillus sp. MMS18-CY102]|uniref:beta-ketoacyl synthase N-terminal-like domain-containing protein n=1 Tax=Paenibacillus sp. MMS18-CY102 TaxID=2682849 RepID=UPI0013653390|nr:beta-ketoacyl synthase N-terminal-like domain-containing protein [Paenibacillus sp. MMS18-CY102]MWC28300.1 hypothetical protein [Paenibacillus sp. MMS18-CY102]
MAHGQQATKGSDIAIIGLGGRFPQSIDYQLFWRKLMDGANLIEPVPASRWDHRRYCEPEQQAAFVPNKTRCQHGAFVPEHDRFDASFFHIRPEEVLALDPQERIALETAWTCMEDAGYTPASLGTDVGLFCGITYGEYQKLLPISSHSYMLNNRIAYFFNFQGPSFTTDAGCCSSLVALHLACRSLQSGDCRTALVTGANLIVHPDHYATASYMLSSSSEPHSSPFGNDDGWVPAEGVVSMLLKPLEQAQQDRDHIYGIIKSSHIRNEGKTSWFGAFNPNRQAALMEEHFRKSGIRPETISYVEAAANGSPLGDAIELEGLRTAFRSFTDMRGIFPVGTVKSNAGHGESVSTMLQLTKLLLQFESEKLLPLLRLDSVNPNLRMEDSPFYLLQSVQEWKRPSFQIGTERMEAPRRATISSFGAGGDMGHLICEENAETDGERTPLAQYFFPLSAPSQEQLAELVNRLIRFFADEMPMHARYANRYSPENVMFTLCTGRIAYAERMAIMADSLESFISQLREWEQGQTTSGRIIRSTEQAGLKDAGAADKAAVWMEEQNWPKLAKLWVSGAELLWEPFFRSLHVTKVSLPGYRFQRQHFPIAPVEARVDSPGNAATAVSAGVDPHAAAAAGNGDRPSRAVKPSSEPKQTSAEAWFIGLFAEALDVPASALTIDSELGEYGFQSSSVLAASLRLEEQFGSFPKTIFFEYQTIGAFIAYFERECPSQMQALSKDGVTMPHAKHEAERPEAESIEKLAKAILSGEVTADWVIQKI